MLSQGLLIKTVYPIKILNQINITFIIEHILVTQSAGLLQTMNILTHLHFIQKCHFCFLHMTIFQMDVEKEAVQRRMQPQ